MLKVTFVLGAILVAFVAESSCQRFIKPTYRPPRQRKPIIRRARDVGDVISLASEVPTLIEELDFLERTVRSLDSPSAKRGGGSHSSSSRDHDTGATHPGYNRRNARSFDSPSAKRGRRSTREIRLPGHLNPLRPKPLYPRPIVPAPVPRIPVYARTVRDIQIPGIRKPTHRDVIIPNWNPNVKTNPWDSLGGKGRHGRSIDFTEVFNDIEIVDYPHERRARDIQISDGLPRKPTHRDVIIPNWNPHARTKPWQSLGGAGRGH
ncbi:uncharacterized protein LOC125228096 [Leguminivora glycinivorella]|uniref:uncharacterized protein LOC125228096 n=1 Tax=Leguminivora glycinivorella TaxID=1035111 RepID=UPI00200BE442|nr:uncharacterized protein LOC125228096 [Leguminivora glycinivorella]